MKNITKNLLYILCFLPFFAKVPYMFEVWKYTPLESGDPFMWIAVVASAAICEYCRRKISCDGEKNKFKLAFALLIICLPLWLLATFKINALAILISIAIIAMGTYLRFGKQVFLSQMPSYLFAALATPSISFWLDYYFNTGIENGLNFLIVKFSIAAMFLLYWNIYAASKKSYPKLKNVFFLLCLCGAIIFNRVQENSVDFGAPLEIAAKTTDSKNWVWINTQISPEDKRFFKGCREIIRRKYVSDKIALEYLELDIDDISNIHPVGICMKSAGYKIEKSSQIYLESRCGKVQVNEVVAKSKDGISITLYSWFTNQDYSSGDFRKFRMTKNIKRKWKHFQIMTSSSDSNENIRNAMTDFFKEFSKKIPE